MFRRSHKTALDRVLMQIFQFLLHDGVIANCLWMHTFLPDLMLAGSLVLSAMQRQLIEKPVAFFEFQLLENDLGSESLEGAQGCGEIRSREDGVEMIIQNNPGMNLQGLMLATMEKRLNENIAPGSSGENGQPVDNSRGDEVGGVRFVNGVTAAHG